MARMSQSIYSPLPQSMSDSDSEKEIQMEPIYNNQRINCINEHQNTRKIKQEVPEKDVSFRTKVSKLRKFGCILSALLFFLFIAVFLWVVPCSHSNACKVSPNWRSMLTNVELLGEINLIRGLRTNSRNLAILYKTSHYSPETLGHGVVSFLGENGKVAWNFQQEITPKKLDCSLIDVNGNGICDCLLLDDRGLKVLGTISGEIIWHVHSSEEGKTICDLGFPIKLTDLNQDGISELIMVYNHDSLLLVCGRSGKALRNIPTHCLHIDDLEFIDNNFIYFSCNNKTKEYVINIDELMHKYNQSVDINIVNTNRTSENNTRVINLSQRILVDITGSYPNCTVKMILYDEFLNKQVKTWNFKHAYVTKPKQFILGMTLASLYAEKTLISGFIFKLWRQPASQLSTNYLNETHIVNKILEQTVLVVDDFSNNLNVYNISVEYITQLCFPLKNISICQPDLTNQKDSIIVGDLDIDGGEEIISYTSSFKMKEGEMQQWELISTVTVINLELEIQKLFSGK